jgi:translation initiation factor 1
MKSSNKDPVSPIKSLSGLAVLSGSPSAVERAQSAASLTPPAAGHMGAGAGHRSALVYATDVGSTCPQCRNAVSACTCSLAHVLLGDGRVRVVLEKRKGKVVTLVSGLALTMADLTLASKALRQACGSGGTTKDGLVEVQGDHIAKCAQWLRANGHKVVQPKP